MEIKIRKLTLDFIYGAGKKKKQEQETNTTYGSWP